MKQTIAGQTFDRERALYNLTDALVSDCIFAGPADGESVLKEARDVSLENCAFSLRYPLWHVRGFCIHGSSMDDKTRAAIWYSDKGRITDSRLLGIKALRECHDVTLENCTVQSEEFGWKCGDITLKDSHIQSAYLFFDSRNVTLENVEMEGKYSFQYMENLQIRGSRLNTKDAFWHSRNVTVVDSVLRGEYLGWFSENLTLINCKIIGTQPLCYCKKLKLVDCTMEGTDLSFEYSQVDATINGHVDSVKNPQSGRIIADTIGEVILGDTVMDCSAEIITRK